MTDLFKCLLIEQSETIASISHSLNFKKLSKPNQTQSKIKGRLEALKELWNSCRALHVRILQVTTPDEQRTNPYFIGEQYLVAEEAYHDAADYMNDALDRFVKELTHNIDRSTDSSYRDSFSSESLQLPRISLPKFSGKFIE